MAKRSPRDTTAHLIRDEVLKRMLKMQSNPHKGRAAMDSKNAVKKFVKRPSIRAHLIAIRPLLLN